MLNRKPSARNVCVCVAIFGAVLTTAGAASLLNSRRNATPGRLVAEQDSVVWEGPNERSPTTIQASAQFVVRNVGGRPVRVIETASSCGCAVPSVRPALIHPGESSVISVEATPILVGEKVATITLKTDSTETPEVALRLHIMGNRRPPFLLRAGGELSFQGDFSATDTREFLVVTIEPEGETGVPLIGNAIPFLTVGAATITTVRHVRPGVVEKQTRYRVGFRGEPPTGAFQSEISVTDPWDKTRVEHLPVTIETVPPIRVVPSYLLITAKADGTESSATFRVMSRTAMPAPSIEIDGGKPSPLIAEVVKLSDDRRSATCRVSFKKGDPPSAGLHEINVYPGPSSKDIAKLPVMVRGVKP